MKTKIVILSFIFSIMLSCIGSTKKSNKAAYPEYEDTYSGVLPCPDCPGIDVTLTLISGNYYRNSTYLGKREIPITEKGTYRFEQRKNIITLNGVYDAPNQYLYLGDSLKQLDIQGKVISGYIAKRYILRRK